MRRVDVAVIGAGAAGALVTVHLARAAPGCAIALIGRGLAGLGVAYATTRPEHLLNVSAGRMSAFPDRPEHFVDWLREMGVAAAPADFVPRVRYGEYVRALLATARRPPARLERDAVALLPAPRGAVVALAGGERVAADAVVLATGLVVPPLPAALGGVARRAWDEEAFAALDPGAPVLLLGTGLSAVDAVLSLAARGHRGTIHALSRHGLWPEPHLPVPLQPRAIQLPRGDLRAMVRAVRAALRDESSRGGDWRAVIDGLRPETGTAWASLDLEARRRFLRHLRALWDAHRHRMAPEAARQVYALRLGGRLRAHAGRFDAVRARSDRLLVSWRERGTGRRVEVEVERVIDCVTAAGLTGLESPLLARAEAAGLLRTDPLGLGIETDGLGAALVEGRPSERVFAVGALRRFERWESTAIPELTAQAAALARGLGERFARAEADPQRA